MADPEQTDALALLLDFRKEYDSLDRHFIVEALRRHGYPEQFVRAVAATHDGTTVQFLANGSKSRSIQVTSGIRQGCPLAPKIFILALEPLYHRKDTESALKDIVITLDAGSFELRVAGYADDTTVYLRFPELVERLRSLITVFGQASGLQLNEE